MCYRKKVIITKMFAFLLFCEMSRSRRIHLEVFALKELIRNIITYIYVNKIKTKIRILTILTDFFSLYSFTIIYTIYLLTISDDFNIMLFHCFFFAV